MNRVLFSKAKDEWETPQDLFDKLNDEFAIGLDVAATSDTRKALFYFGPDHEDESCRDALTQDWDAASGGLSCWMNPPYSRCRDFITKARQEAQRGCVVVCLVPSRTDTRWWHEHVWDASANDYRGGVEVRFLKGRLKFGNSENSAPFPSVVIIFRP